METSDRPRLRPPWRRGVGALAAGTLLVALAACTGSAAPAQTASTGPSSTATGSIGSLSAVALTVADGASAGAASGRSLNLPHGWTAEVWADVPDARMAAWSPDGRLAVSSGSAGEVMLLAPASTGRAPTATTLIRGLDDPQGLAFAEQGGRTILVVGEGTRVTTWNYAGGAVTDRRVLVDGLPDSGHGAKGVAVHGGTVFYSLGSSGNRVPADRTATPERATVWQVDLDAAMPGQGNRVVATGVRNGFGLAIAPDGTLFAAVNQADNQPYPFHDDAGQYGQAVPAYVNENPVDQVSRLAQGTDLGWPYCVPDGRKGPTEVPYVDDPVFNPDGRALDCAGIGRTMVGLPAHSAPLGLAFTHGSPLQQTLGDGALITAHGSWNREPPRTPYVAFSAWDATTATLGAAQEVVTGFQNPDGTRWGRSVAAVPGPDGSAFVTDDLAGLVYRITPG